MTARQSNNPTCPYCRATGYCIPRSYAEQIKGNRTQQPFVCNRCNTAFDLIARADTGRATKKIITRKGQRP